MENKANTSEDVNLNIGKVKPSLKATLDSGRRTSVLSSGFPSNLENTNKKNVDYHFEDSTKSRSRVMQTQSQHLKSDNADVGSQNKLAEMSTKFRNSESGVSHDIDLDGRRGSNRRVPANGSKQDTKRGMGSYPVKESKRQTPNSGEEVPEGRKDSVFVDRSNGDQKKRESSSDENSCSYSKFEKEEPELKGPIKTFSQYKEYVQEYADKYQSYLSLNKILMDYKDEFDKLGVDLENAQRNGDQDRYDDIGAQIMESYRRCASRHMRLKKIFVVLHEELHHGYVRGMGLGPTPSQINGSSCRPSGSTSSSTADAKIAKMQSEIDVLTKEVAEVIELKAKVAEFDAMKEQFALIMANMQNHGSNIGSPFEVRRSSESSHNVEGDQATPDD